MQIEVQRPVASPSDSKKELKVCNVHVAIDLNGTATTMSAQPAVETQRARSCGSFHEEGLGTEDKISGVAPSGRVSVKSAGVGNASISEMVDITGSDQSWQDVVNVEVQLEGSSVPSQAESYEAAVAIKEHYFNCPQAYRKKIVGHRAHHPNPCSSQGALGSHYSRSNHTPST